MRFLLLIVFGFSIMLTSCGNQQTTPSQQQESDKNAEPFEVDTATYENGQVTIHYPQLTNMQNKDLEQRINTLIKDDAILFLSQYQDSNAPLKMDFEVILPESDTFTVQYTGTYNGGMYPTHLLFTTNINFKKGEKIRLSNLFVIDETFIEALKNAKYMDWENPHEPNKEKQTAIIEYLKTYNNQDLIAAFTKADHPDPNENPYGVFSYIFNHTVVISMQVPHALGDHAEFEVDMGELERK
ncbi:hypothetical protein E1I69_17710 [Bacillus timonensis]|uniref:DUF4163 domain-containing protein n=1 Tax=Bacillus timonensis TaxID=1033734 RepID=A0A4S3PMQ6_9BACI|nr:DUF4163 domain-containing protein [Bacillus timonensis]THE10779.1 hypothetical protein E1I69_17710 [Bacillus timonensis]